jgi:hypothetical protein
MNKIFPLSMFFALVTIQCCHAQQYAISHATHHLRNGKVREWSEFPIEARARELKLQFTSHANTSECTLILQQYDVKQNWKVEINGQSLGSLAADEKIMVVYFSIPTGILRNGQNEIYIHCDDGASDDIRVEKISVDKRPVNKVLGEATVEVEVVDSNNTLLPSRLTVVNTDGVLQTVLASDKSLATRPGVIYTANGKALLTLPAGTYRIYAGRGFEYGVDSAKVELKPGDHAHKTMHITHEVDTKGWISSDTHIHTLTHSGHGDATMEERAITLAGEGIEFPIMTDHNIHVDLSPAARVTNVENYFTPVIGNELTTKFGHFNIFPITAGVTTINHNVSDWNNVAENIGRQNQVIILNHARDIHNGFIPFGPQRHLSSAGTSKNDWAFPANAMEVINSGSQQTKIMNLFYDWFGMLNHGRHVTPIGSSDSHDVSRYIVGQGRTYIQGNDSDPSNIDVKTTVQNCLNGKVMVSLGLMTKIIVNGQFGPGELVPPADTLTVGLKVCGPGWTKADRISLYANGKLIKEEKIPASTKVGIKWQDRWNMEFPKHDVFLVAIAEGPGHGMPYWPIAKPYQPASPEWTPRLIGSTGAVWVDGDKNGKRDTAFDYATAILQSSGDNIDQIIKKLQTYDEAVAIQVAALLWKKGVELASANVIDSLKHASRETKAGFHKVVQELRLLEK